jgi:hypothetical protein
MSMGDSLFVNTDYSFNKAVESTYRYATELITENGGKAGRKEFTVKKQLPVAPALEISFPDVVQDSKVSVFDNTAWKFTGNWKTLKRVSWPAETLADQSKFAQKHGDAAEISFSGTGISIDGNWLRDGGKADVFLDGKLVRTIDTYYFYNNQEHENVSLWHITGLPDLGHNLKLVVKGEKKPESIGTAIYISQAVIYKTAPKKSYSYKFSFE